MLEEESKIKWCQFQSGNNEAYSWIYETYIQILYSYGIRFTSDFELVKDCIQEVFTVIYKNRSRLKPPDNVKVYLMVALKNSLIRNLYKQQKLHNLDSSDIMRFTLEPTVEEQFIHNENDFCQQQKIQKILSVLTPRQQEIIYYRFIQELSFEEICSLMDLNYQSAQNLIQRSLKKIRDNHIDPNVYILLFAALI
ncbi:MAG: sigma-70 family RNA polymerase sigma factor [Tannerella sp.]|jgi:RNA polymerase sigma factor (sigma-70 family)|nr:sigma-70 family RNA polymerase sigma factor [Tannerella sp.]